MINKFNSLISMAGVAVSLLLILLCPSMSWGDWSVLFFDDFDDGNYDGWSVTDWKGEPRPAPDVVVSPEGYSLRGVGSGYTTPPPVDTWISHPVSISDVTELKIEMRAKSGPQWPNRAVVYLVSGSDYYSVDDYGEAGENETADLDCYVNGLRDFLRYPIGSRAFEWHTFAWTRDANGWWSLSIDSNVEWEDFCQDNRLTSFDRISLHLLRNQSEIEWVRISTSEPLTHDECENAIAVEADEPYNGSTTRATGTDTSSCSYNDTNDVWHSFTPRFNYEYTISLCGSTFDTTLAVFDDCNGTELACNDDTKPGICSPTLPTLQSQLTMPLVKDLTYFIRIAGYDGETGDYTLTVTGPVCTERPAMDFNDDCKVDFRDFAIFSQSWLDCNLDPPELCWQ